MEKNLAMSLKGGDFGKDIHYIIDENYVTITAEGETIRLTLDEFEILITLYKLNIKI